jgi:hypothetical protein
MEMKLRDQRRDGAPLRMNEVYTVVMTSFPGKKFARMGSRRRCSQLRSRSATSFPITGVATTNVGTSNSDRTGNLTAPSTTR